MSQDAPLTPETFALLRENARADNDLLCRNDALGDVFTRPRDVDFLFKTGEEQRAQALCDYILAMHFADATMRRDEDGLFWVTAILPMPVHPPLICSVSAFMVCLAQLFEVEYDGWGSVIQNG